MNFCDYAKTVIQNTPVSENLQYGFAVMWLHPETLPLGLTSLGETDSAVVKVPACAKNRYGRFVPVIAVGGNAFCGNQTVTDVILSSHIERLPQNCFAGCTALRNITIPKRIKEIKQGTFDGCVNLENVYYEGTPEEWAQMNIVRERHEIEFGEPIPGTPLKEITSERLVHIPGNDALFSATIHFRCELEKNKPATFVVGTGSKDITDLFRTM